MPRAKILDANQFDLENNLDISMTVQLFSLFQMFDHLVASIGVPSMPERLTAPRLSLQYKLPSKLTKVSEPSPKEPQME